jgi:methylmalonyl-CoA mutase N-terminal domain/subunit
MNSSLKTNNQWEIIEGFDDPTNSDLLFALQNGTNGLRINFKTPYSKEEIAALFEGIHLDFINIYLEGNTSAVALAKELVKKDGQSKIYTFKNIDFEEELKVFLENAKDYLSSCSEAETPIVAFGMNNEYLDNISKIRSIQILWVHLLKSYKLEKPELKLIANIENYEDERSLEEDYIFASVGLMSSVIGGADAIEISAPIKPGKDRSFRSRIARNLHHLASMEARMNLVRDPLKGSYHIEKCSNEYAELAWKKFTI